MSTFVLKIIAIVTMLIDHIGAILLSNGSNPGLYVLFRGIGRLAFPIFVFLIVEGFHHTGDINKYLKRLGVFAFLSELPFDIAFYQYNHNRILVTDIRNVFTNGFDEERLENIVGRMMEHQNVFFTLFLGLLAIYLMSLVEKRYEKNILISNLLDAVITIGFSGIAIFLKTDYDYTGILMIVAFYLFRSSKAVMAFSLLIIAGSMQSDPAKFLQTGNITDIISIFATLAMIPIAFYNGKKGKNVKYIFYIFYPAHLLLLFLINQFLL